MSDQEILNRLESLLDKDEYGGPLHEVRTREFESFFNHLFSVVPESEGFTDLWFDEDTSTNAAINRDAADVILHCDASENEHAQLETTERINYPPGTAGAGGWTFRPEQLPTGEQNAWSGVTDGNDGVGIGIKDFSSGEGKPTVTSAGVQPYIFYERTNQTRILIPQEHWNKDTMDGSGDENNPSGEDINDLLDGAICRIDPQLYYGHGVYTVQLLSKRGSNGVELDGAGGVLLLEDADVDLVKAHNIVVKGEAMVDQPNVPVTARAETNGTGSQPIDIHWTAVHYERARSIANNRLNGVRRSGITVGTAWEPLISWQKRSGWEQVNSRPVGVVVASDTDLELDLQLGVGLNNASFGLPPHTTSSETALEFDTSADGFSSTGERRWVDQVVGGQGNKESQAQAALEFNLPANRILTLAAKADSSGATVSAVALTGSEF